MWCGSGGWVDHPATTESDNFLVLNMRPTISQDKNGLNGFPRARVTQSWPSDHGCSSCYNTPRSIYSIKSNPSHAQKKATLLTPVASGQGIPLESKKALSWAGLGDRYSIDVENIVQPRVSHVQLVFWVVFLLLQRLSEVFFNPPSPR
ncbi:unnamed protein product [Periconia digitata]|uniref:Uncharacterized protein n=1 Tax=Periconia digitata TaxID=1303443 RepID=A0A9W4UC90_9PLEO|nr:unnamed protein product [Periconia digitata]